MDRIAFFESGENIPEKHERTYSMVFNRESRNINIELNVINLQHTIADQEVKVKFVLKSYVRLGIMGYYKIIGTYEDTMHIASESLEACISKGWKSKEIGYWTTSGIYKVETFVNDDLFAEEEFYIDLSMEHLYTDMKTLDETNQEIQYLKELPEGIKYEILQQYQVTRDYNTYYPIKFSEDGYDLAFLLSYYSKVTGSFETTITRNVRLFKNSKQIFPTSFVLDPYFDKDLQN